MMLRLLLLTLLLTVMAATLDTKDLGSGDGDFPDDEIENESERIKETHTEEVKNGFEDQDIDDGSTTIIIIAAVSVVAIAILAIIAVVLFKRHLQRREQGVYSVPVEQGQKGV